MLKVERHVRVIKRDERRAELSLYPFDRSQTEAQQKRAMVSVVMSWIQGRENSATNLRPLWLYETKHKRSAVEQEST